MAGTWVLSVTLDVGTGDATFVFVVDGSEISGTYSGVLGDQEVTGTIEGNIVKFGFSSDGAGETTFEGTIDGDTMEGTCEYDLLGPGTFSGRRSGPDRAPSAYGDGPDGNTRGRCWYDVQPIRPPSGRLNRWSLYCVS